jgi:hypothetical protein
LAQVRGDRGADGFQVHGSQRVTLGQVFDLTGYFAYYSEFGRSPVESAVDTAESA